MIDSTQHERLLITKHLLTCVTSPHLFPISSLFVSQNDAPRGGGGRGGVVKESGLHQLYVVANSLQCVKSSGDRGVNMDMRGSNTSGNSSVRGGGGGGGGGGGDSSTDINTSETPDVNIGIGRPSLVCFSASEIESVRRIALSEGAGGCMGLLVASLCPSIFGHELVKLGLMLGEIHDKVLKRGID